MRFVSRAAALASVAALTATLLLFRPGSEPQAAAQQPAGELPPDLALVPADALGFVHVRAADLWKNETLAPFRAIFEKAGPKAHAALDAQFVPRPSTFDRATAFLLLDAARKKPIPVVVLRFSAPFDPAEVVRTHLPGAAEKKVGGVSVYSAKGADAELAFPDKQHIVIGMAGTLEGVLGLPKGKAGPLSGGLKLAASGRPVVGSLNLSALPPEALKDLKDLPPEVQALLRAEHVTASLDLTKAAKVEVIASYKTAADAAAAEKAVKSLAEYARKELAKLKADIEKELYEPKTKGPRPAEELPLTLLAVFGLGAVNQLDEMLANPGAFVKRSGNDLTASVSLPKELVVAAGGVVALGAALILPAVAKVRGAAARMQSQNNLKQIALACHNYYDANGHFPADITDKNGKPLLSWRVAILPYIEQDNVYKQFKLDEPWDSPNNKKWSQLAIKTFLSPNAPAADVRGMTHYQGFSGPGAVFEPGKKIRFPDITDGTSNTILAIETAEAVEWAKPGGIPFDPKKPLPKLTPAGEGFSAALCDGSVRFLAKSIDEKTLKAAITRNGGEVLGPGW